MRSVTPVAWRAGGLWVLAALLLMAAGPKITIAQIPCDGSCDSVAMIATKDAPGCVKLRVVNRDLDGGGIFAYRIITSPISPNYICGISSGTLNPSDPSRIWNRNTYAYMTEDPDSSKTIPNSRYFWDASFLLGHIDTAALPPCDSGWIELCICCGLGSFDMPIQLVTYHWNPATNAIDSCVSQVMNPAWFSDACGGGGGGAGGYVCNDTCDEISASTETVAGEFHICVTVTRKRIGAETAFTLKYLWPAGCHRDSLRLLSPPEGWVATYYGDDSITLRTDSVADVIPNCGSGTFCFALGDCDSTLCTNFQIELETLGDHYTYACVDTVTVFGLPAKDNECCTTISTSIIPDPDTVIGGVTMTNPTQDTVTGVWTQCFVIHESNNNPLTRVVIDHNAPVSPNPRCWEVSSVPWGWKLSGSNGSIDTFAIDGADTVGCRTFEWCYSTCDCQEDGVFNNNFQISDPVTGETFTPMMYPVPTMEANAVCCNGAWHKHDYLTVTGASPTCVTLKYFNTHHVNNGCCDDDHFTFTLPSGCLLTGITLPAGWCWDTVGAVVNISPCADVSSRLACCSSLTATLCTDCNIGFSSWTTDWSTSDTCGDTFVDTVSYCGGCAGSKQSLPHSSSPAMGEMGGQNFPNPFGAETGFRTTIPFQTNGTGTAYIRVFNQAGAVILNDNEAVTYAGTHFFYFTGKELPAGSYYYQIEFPNGVVIVNRTMILVK